MQSSSCKWLSLIKDSLPIWILLTNIYYCTGHMEQALKYYQIVISEDSNRVRIDTVLKNNCYKIANLRVINHDNWKDLNTLRFEILFQFAKLCALRAFMNYMPYTHTRLTWLTRLCAFALYALYLLTPLITHVLLNVAKSLIKGNLQMLSKEIRSKEIVFDI